MTRRGDKGRFKKIAIMIVTISIIISCGLVGTSKAQENPYALQTQVIQNQQQIKVLQQQQAQLFLKLESLLVRYGEIKGQLDSISHRLDLLQEQINQLMLKMGQPQTPSLPSSPKVPEKMMPLPNTQVQSKTSPNTNVKQNKIKQASQTAKDKEIIDNAIKLYKEKKYDQVIVLLQNFQNKYKTSKYIPEAIFYLAQSYFAKGEYDKAIINYDYLVNTYPKNVHVAEATLKEGISFIKMGDSVDGNYLLQKVIKEFPNSKEAKEAKKILGKNS